MQPLANYIYMWLSGVYNTSDTINVRFISGQNVNIPTEWLFMNDENPFMDDDENQHRIVRTNDIYSTYMYVIVYVHDTNGFHWR